jgi:hypothetical protein
MARDPGQERGSADLDCVQKRGILRTTLVRSSEASVTAAGLAALHAPPAVTRVRASPAAANEQKITFVLATYDGL